MASLPERHSLIPRYAVENNTAKRALDDTITKRVELEIGDSKQPDFKPQVKFLKWDNECNFSVRAEEHPDAYVETEGEKIKYITPDYELHQYELDNGFEFEWVLPKKPLANVFKATTQFKGLIVAKQTSLLDPAMRWEREDAVNFSETEVTNVEGKVLFKMPENVVNSLALYHIEKQGEKNGDKNYASGKFGHIYRIKAIDANGNWAWGDQNFYSETNSYEVTVPQDFLDSAVYPVRVDPNFGWESVGASAVSIEDVLAMGRFTMGANAGTGNSMSFAFDADTNTRNSLASIYVDETGEADTNTAKLTNGDTGVTTIPIATNTWTTYTFTSSPTLAASTVYRLAVSTQPLAGACSLNYDASITGANAYQRAYTYDGTMPDPSGAMTRNSTVRASAYCTYTESGGTAVKDIIGMGIIPFAR